MRTKNPTEEFFSEVQLGYEEAAERGYGHVIVAGPLTDTWGGRLGLKYETAEGLFENIYGKGDATVEQPPESFGPNYGQYVAVGTLRGEFDRGDISLKVYTGERDGDISDYNQIQLVSCNALTIGNTFSDCSLNETYAIAPATTVPGSSRYTLAEPDYSYEMTQVTIEGNYQINDTWEFNNIIGWVDINNFYFGNIGPRTGQLSLGLHQDVETISEEFRFSGDFDNFRVMFGAFYDDRLTEQGAAIHVAPSIKTTPDSETEIESDSWSVFAQMDIDLTEQLELSLGARYSEETRSFSGQNLEDYNFLGMIQYFAGPHNAITDEVDYTNLSPELALSWRPRDNVTLFVTYKEGFKSGGFNMSGTERALSNASLITPGGLVPLPEQEFSYNREDVAGYELGAKLELLDNTLRVNTAIFSYEYTELQSAVIVPSLTGTPASRTINAGEATIRGFETDLLWQTPWEPLTVSANLAFNDNEFGSFITQCNEFQRFTEGDTGCNVDVDGDLSTNAGGTNSVILNGGFDGQDRDGHPLRRAPEWSGSIGLNFDTALSETLRFKANVLASYSDEYQADGENNPLMVQDSYWLLNGGLGIYAEDGSWSVDLIGRNLNDEVVELTTFDLGATGSDTVPQDIASSRNNPREIMIQFTFRPDLFL